MRAVAVISVIILSLLLVQTGAARQDSGWFGPESSVYPLKIWMEKLSLNLVFNQTERTQKMLDMTEERLNEAEGVENSSRAFERAMAEYTDQLEELQDIIKTDADNKTKNIRIDIKERIEEQKNRTKALKSQGRVSIIQQSIIEASSGESQVKVSIVNGNVSVYTEGGNATVTRDGNNVTVVSVANNSRQQVIVRSSQDTSSSSIVSSSVSSSNAIAVASSSSEASINSSGISINSSGMSVKIP